MRTASSFFSGLNTLTIFGITSPARLTTTESPTLNPKRSISSMLCKVVLLTVTPPTNTGFNRATGVITPVLPTWNSTSNTVVDFSSAGNL